jgi:hypothetical protein
MTGNVVMATTRVVLGAAGLAAAAYGTVTLLGLGAENLLATLPWLLGGVVAHDAVLAPLVVLTGVIAAVRLPGWARGAAAAALVVLGSVTLAAVPALGRFGARPDNPTLLDRPYAAGWAALAALVLVVAGTAALATRRRGGEHRG